MEQNYGATLFARYRRKGLLIDTNLLLVLVVGTYDKRRVTSFKRTAKYTLEDFLLLQNAAASFEQLWTTPNILTEVDNLGRQLPENEWLGFSSSMKALTSKLSELYAPSIAVTSSEYYARLGLTDTANLSKLKSLLLLSDDLRLITFAQIQGIDAINFNNIRQYN